MTTLYKITDAEGFTRRAAEYETRWGAGVTHEAHGGNSIMCNADLIHAYEDPLIAAFMHPEHIDHSNPVLWEAEGEIVFRDGQLRCGVKRLTTVKIIPLPYVSMEQRVEIAIRCALTCSNGFARWAEAWLDGSDRSPEAAAAEWDSVRAAEKAAWAAAQRADSSSAVTTASQAAAAAVSAHRATSEASNGLDLLSIIRKVVKI